MATEPQPQPVQPPFLQVPCSACKKEMIIKMPAPVIMNSLGVSLVAFVHERFDKCPHCGTMFIPQVQGLAQDGSINMQWVQVQTPQSAILPPTQENMQRAVTIRDLQEKVKGRA